MAAEQNPNAQPLPPVPPIRAGESPTLPRVTIWPKRLGIVSIVFAALGAVASVTFFYIGPALQLQAKTDGQREFINSPMIRTWLTTNNVYAGICLALAAALLVAGVGLILRRAWSVKMLVIWAWLKIIVEAASTILGYLMHQRIEQAISQGLVDEDNVVRVLRAWSLAGEAVSLAAFCCLAIFVLIWFARSEVRENVTTWR